MVLRLLAVKKFWFGRHTKAHLFRGTEDQSNTETSKQANKQTNTLDWARIRIKRVKLSHHGLSWAYRRRTRIKFRSTPAGEAWFWSPSSCRRLTGQSHCFLRNLRRRGRRRWPHLEEIAQLGLARSASACPTFARLRGSEAEMIRQLGFSKQELKALKAERGLRVG